MQKRNDDAIILTISLRKVLPLLFYECSIMATFEAILFNRSTFHMLQKLSFELKTQKIMYRSKAKEQKWSIFTLIKQKLVFLILTHGNVMLGDCLVIRYHLCGEKVTWEKVFLITTFFQDRNIFPRLKSCYCNASAYDTRITKHSFIV